jgi:hypothetical protein
MVLMARKKKVEEKIEEPTLEVVAPAKPDNPTDFCKANDIGGCCAQAIKRTWHLR